MGWHDEPEATDDRNACDRCGELHEDDGLHRVFVPRGAWSTHLACDDCLEAGDVISCPDGEKDDVVTAEWVATRDARRAEQRAREDASDAARAREHSAVLDHLFGPGWLDEDGPF